MHRSCIGLRGCEHPCKRRCHELGADWDCCSSYCLSCARDHYFCWEDEPFSQQKSKVVCFRRLALSRRCVWHCECVKVWKINLRLRLRKSINLGKQLWVVSAWQAYFLSLDEVTLRHHCVFGGIKLIGDCASHYTMLDRIENFRMARRRDRLVLYLVQLLALFNHYQ
jgi:hypothetical protein